MKGAFENAQGLKNFAIQGFDTSSVTSMNSLFKGTNFADINTEGLDSQNVEDMSYMFSYIPSIQYIYIQNLDTSKVKNMSHMFSNNPALISLI